MKISNEYWLCGGCEKLLVGPKEKLEKMSFQPMKLGGRVSNPSTGARYVMFAYNSWSKSIF